MKEEYKEALWNKCGLTTFYQFIELNKGINTTTWTALRAWIQPFILQPSFHAFLVLLLNILDSCDSGMESHSLSVLLLFWKTYPEKHFILILLNPCTAKRTVPCLTIYRMILCSPILEYFHHWTRRSVTLKTGSNALFGKTYLHCS